MSDKPDHEVTMDLPAATKAELATSAKQDDMMEKQDSIIAQSKRYEFVASDVLEKSDDDEETVLTNTYTLIKTIDFNPTGVVYRAKLRIKFDMKRPTACTGSGYGRIYRNGVAVGTERINATDTYVTYSEDIDQWSVFDDIELYGKGSGVTPGVTVRNFRVYATIQEITYEPSW